MSSSIQRSANNVQRARSTAHRAVAHRTGARRAGFTVVEIMVVVAIIAILVVVVAWGGSRLLNDAKVKQTHSLMNSLKSAMAACKAASGLVESPRWSETVPVLTVYPGAPRLDVTEVDGAGTIIRTDYYRQARNGTNWNPLTMPTADRVITVGSDEPLDGIWALPDGTYQSNPTNYQSNGLRIFGIQALYHCLMQEPQSKQILSGLPASNFVPGTKLKEYFGSQVSDYLIGPGAGTTRPHETQAIVDAWGVPLYYGKKSGVNNDEAYLQSAGPDGKFGTEDDVFSFKE